MKISCDTDVTLVSQDTFRRLKYWYDPDGEDDDIDEDELRARRGPRGRRPKVLKISCKIFGKMTLESSRWKNSMIS